METPDPELLDASSLEPTDHGRLGWDAEHNAHVLTVSSDERVLTWGPRKPENTAKYYPPAWVPARTLAHFHSGTFRWDFVVEELAAGQIGVGFMLQWNIGPDWGFFGYLGASNSAWAYDLRSGDVVNDTRSIEGGLPKSVDGHTGVVGVELELPRHAAGSARFVCDGRASRPIELPPGAVVLPAACLLREGQRVRLGIK